MRRVLMPGNAITLKDGKVEQTQLTDYTPLRMVDARRSTCTSAPARIRRPGWASPPLV